MVTVEDRIRAFRDISKWHVNDKFMDWLINNDFFTAPASRKFHGAYESGLFDHSVNVTIELLSFTKNLNLRWKNRRSPFIVGMFHDLCKIDNYIVEDGVFVHNKTSMPGHGEKSVKLLRKFVKDLTDEEELCIRWHMGAFDGEENWRYYTEAVQKYPNVLFTHTADMLASQARGL